MLPLNFLKIFLQLLSFISLPVSYEFFQVPFQILESKACIPEVKSEVKSTENLSFFTSDVQDQLQE